MPAHKHAELMMQYAEDAIRCPQPWYLWQMREGAGCEWVDLLVSPQWRCAFEYRRKPQLREFWINIYPTGNNGAVAFTSYDRAVDYATPDCLRKAVHFREVME